MSLNKELNSKLFIQREECVSHVEYNHEFAYYNNITAGNVEEVRKILVDPQNIDLYDQPEYGKLSSDSVRNMRYHFVVSVALITRLCVEKGLERELAYTLSDLYIGKMDLLSTKTEIITLYNKMLLDFTYKMAQIPKNKVYSIHVIKTMDYVSKHRNEQLTVSKIANALKINRSYLSAIFIKETGESLGKFIRHEKMKAAVNMLRFSECSYTDIAEYLGFSSQSYFIKCFKTETGFTPKEYRKIVSSILEFK